jgi:hypothetical protein
MNKVFLPVSISLLSIAIIVVSLASSGLIKGVSKEKQLAEVKGEAISVTQTLIPTITPTPTVVIKKDQVETYITPTPTLIPTIEPTATPTIQKPDNRAKLDVIANQFKKIAELNTQITTYQIIAADALKNYSCDLNKWGQQYLSNGEPNPNYVMDNAKRREIYEQCLSTQYSLSYTSQIDGLKYQIRDINNQVQGIIATCSGSECNNYYWDLVNGFEAKGFMVR